METPKKEIVEQVLETPEMVLSTVFSGLFADIPLEDDYNIGAPFIAAIEKVSDKFSIGWIIPVEDKISKDKDYIVYYPYMRHAELVTKNLAAIPIYTGSEYHFSDADIKVIGITGSFKLEITRYAMIENNN